MREPEVAVIIPTLNSAAWIRRAIDSVLTQTYRGIEVIVVDGGSIDDTWEVLGSYEDRLTRCRQGGSGVNAARNTGILRARGRLLAFLDSDDYWLPAKLGTQIAQLKQTKRLWCYSDVYVRSPSGRLMGRMSSYLKMHDGPVQQALLIRNFIASPTPVVARSVFDEVGLFDETLISGEDWEMWLRIAGRFEVSYVDAPLAVHCQHAESNGATLDCVTQCEMKKRVVEKTVLSNPSGLGALHQSALSRLFVDSSLRAIKAGRRRIALRMLLDAARCRPLGARPYALMASLLLPGAVIKGVRSLRWYSRRVRGSLVNPADVEPVDI